MSRLEFYARPLVAFDPKNKDHRRWYYDFVKFKGWGRCPVRFICPNDIGYDLTIMIRNELIDYYVNQEFKPVVRKQQTKTVAQKAKKTVDKRVKK
jgi:hypothetical protein